MPHLLEDADIPEAVAGITAGATVLTGQMCIAATRVLAHERVAPPLRQGLKERFERPVVSPGLDPCSEMTPLVDVANRDRVKRLAEKAAAEGEVIVPATIPGSVPPGGAFLRPALIAVET